MSGRIMNKVTGFRGSASALVLALGIIGVPMPGHAQSADQVDLRNLQDAAVRAESSGQWEEAIRIHKIRAIVAPAAAETWVRISDIEARRGDTNAALGALVEAVKASPSNATLHARLSQGYSMANRPKDAFASMEQAVALAPSNTSYLLSQAQLANWIGRSDVAADSCERILEMKKDDKDALLLLARTRMWQGELDEATGLYRRYLHAHPEHAEAYLEHAKVEAWRGNFCRASLILKEYGQAFGNPARVDREQARIYASADKPDAAMALNEPLLKTAPGDFELLFTRAVALHYDNQPRESMETVDMLTKLRPDSREAAGIRSFVDAGLRPDIRVGGRYYSDNDKIRISHEEVTAGMRVRPETRVIAGAEANTLRARKGSGLENIDGSSSVEEGKLWVGLRHIFMPALWADVRVGHSEVKDIDKRLAYSAEVGMRPCDSLRLNLAYDTDYLMISPRSASVPVERDSSRVTAQWEPGLLYTIVGAAKYDDLSDGNSFHETVLAPRKSVLRREDLNMDLGVRGIWSGYARNLTTGYYDPSDYRQYMLTVFGYWKLGAGCGLGIMAAGGYYRDNTMDDYSFGWGADTELTVGAFGDWMFKLSAHAMENKREIGEPFKAYAASTSLSRRF